jgi:hypothetical protein
VRSEDTVTLRRDALDVASHESPDIRDFLSGVSDWFPPFDVPTYEGDQGWVKISESRYENTGFYGGVAEARLVYFAYIVRAFRWNDDPRRDRLMDLVHRANSSGGTELLESATTQDLWDALFTCMRGDRFVDGLIASTATELTIVANEIRRRLLEGRGRNQ